MTHPIHDHRYPLIAKLLIQIRLDRGLRQQDLADRLKRTQTFVSKYESGSRRVDLIELLDILHALDADPHEFIDRVQAQSLPQLPR
ncbi:helix-turn-helix domain-containing protein [Burkholderia sp. FERM BP-3421]|uniref:helix-turn-helix domain-containing protein n=1 Tax=Burkholderia sp. FERM BP-3421 TaxID=1494466 RepID=UPI00235E2845|nr:helix-turn-helix transcriptional regulator [Burkholderia sp. FERM BP-3421]WDD94854.1 helix-turn-helix domain-containing protein [Burkholderia sp. FERM BP-3421]